MRTAKRASQFGDNPAPTGSLPISVPGSDTHRTHCLNDASCASFPSGKAGAHVFNVYALIVALLGLALCIWAAVLTEIDNNAMRAVLAVAGLTLMTYGIWHL